MLIIFVQVYSIFCLIATHTKSYSPVIPKQRLSNQEKPSDTASPYYYSTVSAPPKSKALPREKEQRTGKFSKKTVSVMYTMQGDVSLSPTPYQSLRLGKMLGSGGFCEVYPCTVDGKVLVARIAKRKQGDSYKFFENGYRNLRVFSGLGISPQVFNYFHLENDGRPGCLMERMAGDLHKCKQLPFDKRKEIAKRVIRIVGEMHKAGFYHGDLKPGNFLVDADWNVYISDIDSVADIRGGSAKSIAGGTRGYKDPQLLADRQKLKAQKKPVVSPAWMLVEADVFSTTLTCFFLLVKKSFSSHLLTTFRVIDSNSAGNSATTTFEHTDWVFENFSTLFKKWVNDVFFGKDAPTEDPFVKFFVAGTSSNKKLSVISDLLDTVTEKSITDWQSIFAKYHAQKLLVARQSQEL